jgi:cytochrome b pre-mRNA-processing protein 3
VGEEQQAIPGVLGAWRTRRAGRRRAQAAALRLYHAIVAQARAAELFGAGGLPDTTDGRFEALALHAALVMRRLRDGGTPGALTAQALFDLMFADMDRSLREMGVGDLSVGKWVKGMAASFLARAQALEAAIDAGGPADVAAVVARNLPGAAADRLVPLGSYALAAWQDLSALDPQALADGAVPSRWRVAATD